MGEFPIVTFVGGKIVFARERWFQRLLHNETALAIQKRLSGWARRWWSCRPGSPQRAPPDGPPRISATLGEARQPKAARCPFTSVDEPFGRHAQNIRTTRGCVLVVNTASGAAPRRSTRAQGCAEYAGPGRGLAFPSTTSATRAGPDNRQILRDQLQGHVPPVREGEHARPQRRWSTAAMCPPTSTAEWNFHNT
jgi:hypothetical protein